MPVDREAAAARIAAAMQGMADAKTERDQAVADGLKAGLSVREVHLISGMSTRTVQDIGHANGWPTPAMKRKWAEQKAERERFNAVVDHYRTHGRLPD